MVHWDIISARDIAKVVFACHGQSLHLELAFEDVFGLKFEFLDGIRAYPRYFIGRGSVIPWRIGILY